MTNEQAYAYAVVALCRIPVSERTTDYEGLTKEIDRIMRDLIDGIPPAEIIEIAKIAMNKGRTGEKMVSKKAAQDYGAVALATVPEQLRETDLMYAISLYAQMDKLMQEYTPAQIRAQAQELLDGEVY